MSKLVEIAEVKRAEVARLAARRGELVRAAESAPPALDFAGALRRPGVSVIAEMKRRSPSAGWIAEGADAAGVAREYEAGGAAALSILTDTQFFGGSLGDLERVRAAVELPLLRKDFVIDEVQLAEARVAGADAALLIVRMLEPAHLRALLDACAAYGLAALVEVHDAAELATAVESGAQIIGINSRDLATFRTDLSVALELVSQVPPDRIAVAESGIRNAADAAEAGARGADAVLVGETLMRAADRGALLAGLRAPVVRPRSAAVTGSRG
jgi:indole-3-glycerol phosphate synthase